MVMKNPPHPGRSIKDACLDPLGLTVTEGARVLDVARHTLSRLINAQAGISLIWPFDLKRLLAAVPMFGYACKRLMILHRQGLTKTALM